MSSFSYLKSINVDYIKIDGIKTIAEYVENETIIKQLTELDVDSAQGWAVEGPQPFTSFKA
jgi:EAL domain-containing protein (putative c-di-GMP-specific phosphodiesterase class I)